MKTMIPLAFLLTMLAGASWGDLTIERATTGPHATLAPLAGAAPARGVTITDPRTGLKLRRISDVGDDAETKLYDGITSYGMTNGYSTYSCANINDQYVIAYGVQGWLAALYTTEGVYVRMLKHRESPTREVGLGDSYYPRWDLSGRPGTQLDLYYQYYGGQIWRQNALTGEQALVMTVPLAAGEGLAKYSHADQSRHRGYWINGSRGGAIDLWTGQALVAGLPGTGEPDVSPSSWWVLQGFSFYRTIDLAAGIGTPFARVPTAEYGHAGWGYDPQGAEVFVFQDNKTDWFSAYAPARGERTDIWNMADWGYPVNQHLGRTSNKSKKGWILFSTYGTPERWYGEQLFMLEIRPAAAGPRLWRLGGFNSWIKATNEKGGAYFTENWASLAPTGGAVYGGWNWYGRDNMELYRLELPEAWEITVMGAPAPTPTPTPAPTVTPTPTPKQSRSIKIILQGEIPGALTGTVELE